jgi:hypothetical protein
MVGTILGATKDVDMLFTREHGIRRIQVMVIDPNLIPDFVDVVIGDFLYEVQFRVEIEDNSPHSAPMDMDNKEDDSDAHGGSSKKIDKMNERNNTVGRKHNLSVTEQGQEEPWSVNDTSKTTNRLAEAESQIVVKEIHAITNLSQEVVMEEITQEDKEDMEDDFTSKIRQLIGPETVES